VNFALRGAGYQRDCFGCHFDKIRRSPGCRTMSIRNILIAVL
jgi:hypothetical protein